MASACCGCGETEGCISVCCPCYNRGQGCTQSCACKRACGNVDISDGLLQRQEPQAPISNPAHQAGVKNGALARHDAAALVSALAVERQYTQLHPPRQAEQRLQTWHGSPEHPGLLQAVTPKSHTSMSAWPVLDSRVIWHPAVQSAPASIPALALMHVGMDGVHHEMHLASLPPPRESTAALPVEAADPLTAGMFTAPAHTSNIGVEPEGRAAESANCHGQPNSVAEQHNVSSSTPVREEQSTECHPRASIPPRGTRDRSTHATPHLSVLSSINALALQQLPSPVALTLGSSDPPRQRVDVLALQRLQAAGLASSVSSQSGSLKGPPSMLSATGMEPSIPQPPTRSGNPWWHLSPVASTQEDLPSSQAPAQLLQPGMTDAIPIGLSDKKTVERPFVQTSSSGPSKKNKVRRARILKDGQLTMIVYGADEALKWQLRIGKFFGVIRGVLGKRSRVEGQWGGSVLDSVVGVFLTQNVSDALSSKAWMNLASTFPLLQSKKDCLDSMDWEAVRTAPVDKVAEAIKCRGMQNKLAAGIQTMLNKIRQYGRKLPRKGMKVSVPKASSKAAAEPPAVTAEAMWLSSGSDSQSIGAAGTLSTESRTSLLTSKIKDLLANVRREPAAHGVESRAQPRLRPDSVEPQTPRLSEALPRPGRTLSPGCPGLVPKLGRAPGPDCPSPLPNLGRTPSPDSQHDDHGAPAGRLSGKSTEVNGGSTFLESWHEPAGELHSRSYFAEKSTISKETYKTATTRPSSTSNSRGSRDPSSKSIDSSVKRADPSSLNSEVIPQYKEIDQSSSSISREPLDMSSDSRISNAGPSSTNSQITEAEQGSRNSTMLSELKDLSDSEGYSEEDDSCFTFDSSEEAGCFVPACTEQCPVQLQISIQQAPMGAPQQQHVCVRLYVTESLQGVRYVAPSCDPEVMQECGSLGDHPLSLEWLRHVHVEESRQYLMDVAGLGRKSVACVLLLSLSRKEFPVDVNVARICARLGWIPLDSDEAIEEMDKYAPEKEVHEYLRSRLMHFDLETLYELHYQMITLGKVFCTKRNPNCRACPLRHECDYALANGQHLEPGLVRPKKATARGPRKSTSRANAILALPAADSPFVSGGKMMPAQGLNPDMTQPQMLPLLSGQFGTIETAEHPAQQPLLAHGSVNGPARHSSSSQQQSGAVNSHAQRIASGQQVPAAEEGTGGLHADPEARRLNQLPQQPVQVHDGSSDAAQAHVSNHQPSAAVADNAGGSVAIKPAQPAQLLRQPGRAPNSLICFEQLAATSQQPAAAAANSDATPSADVQPAPVSQLPAPVAAGPSAACTAVRNIGSPSAEPGPLFQLPEPVIAGFPAAKSAAHNNHSASREPAPFFQLPMLIQPAPAQEKEVHGYVSAARVSSRSFLRGVKTSAGNVHVAVRSGTLPAQQIMQDMPPLRVPPPIQHALQPQAAGNAEMLQEEQHDDCQPDAQASDVSAQQDERQNDQANLARVETDQDGTHIPAARMAIRDAPGPDTISVDAGGPSRCVPPHQIAEGLPVRLSYMDTESVDITGSSIPAPSAQAADGLAELQPFNDTLPDDIMGTSTPTHSPSSAAYATAANVNRAAQAEHAQQGPVTAHIESSRTDSAPGCVAAPVIDNTPEQREDKYLGCASKQQEQQEDGLEAGQLSRTGRACKRPRGAQQGATEKGAKLRKIFRELDAEPSSSVMLSGSLWLPPNAAKTRQQARASQPVRELRGRLIPIPSRISAKQHGGPELQEALISPPEVEAPAQKGSAEDYKGNASVRVAAAAARETAGDMSEHAQNGSLEGGHQALPHMEGVQQPNVSAPGAEQSASLDTVQPAKRPEQQASWSPQRQKGNRELHGLLTAATAAAQKHMDSAPLLIEPAGRTRGLCRGQEKPAREVRAPVRGAANTQPAQVRSAPVHQQAARRVSTPTPKSPLSLRQEKPNRELAKLLHAATEVQPKDVSSAPLHLQATGRTRAESYLKLSSSKRPLSLRKDGQGRELADLLTAAAQVLPKEASNAAVHLQATRRTRGQSSFQPSTAKTVPSMAQATQKMTPMPKPMRGLRELLALHDTAGSSAPAADRLRSRHATKPQPVGTACKSRMHSSSVAAAAQDKAEDRKLLGRRKHRWAASGQVTGQLGSPNAPILTRRADQLTTAKGERIAQRTRGQEQRLGLRLFQAGIGRQPSKGSKLHKKQVAQKLTVRLPMPDMQMAHGSKGRITRNKQLDLGSRKSMSGCPVMLTVENVSRAPSRIASAAAARPGSAARSLGPAPSKARRNGLGASTRHTVPYRRGLVPRRAAKPALRRMIRGNVRKPSPREAEIAPKQGTAEPQQPDESSLRRSKRAGASEHFHEVLKQLRDPMRAARAAIQKESRAMRQTFLGQKALSSPQQAGHPLSIVPQDEVNPGTRGVQSSRGTSQRPQREASASFQQVMQSYKSSLKSSAAKRAHQSPGSNVPCKRARSERRRRGAKVQYSSAAAANVPPMEADEAAEPSGGVAMSMQQGWGMPSAQIPRAMPLRSQQEFTVIQPQLRVPSISQMPSMPQDWSLPAPQNAVGLPMRPQQASPNMLPEFRQPEPVPRSPGVVAFGHAANVSGGRYHANAASAMQHEQPGYFQRAASKQAARLTTPGTAMQKAPRKTKAPRQSRAPKHVSQGMQAGLVPAHEGSKPVVGIEHAGKAKQPAPSLHTGASNSLSEGILGDAECLQSKVLLGVLERGKELTNLQLPQADASRSDGELPDRVLEAAAGVLQLASAEADNMEALTIDELLQSWGRGTIRKRFHELSMQVHPDKCSLPKADQAFALLMRAQQMLICHLERSEQGEVAPDEAPADRSGPDTIPEQHLFKVFQAYEVPLASASAIVGMDYSASLQASSIPLLLLPFPEDASAYASSAAQAANIAATDHSCVFSSPTTVDKAAGSGAAARSVSTHAKGLDSAAASCSPASEQWHQSQLNTLLDPAAMSTDENAEHESSMEPHESQAAVDQFTEQQVARFQQNEPAQDGEGLTRSGGQKMRCVLLIPCCEAVHGRFPLNGTYFQTNEVFLDFSTLQQPIMVSVAECKSWQQHSVYFGSTVASVCRGMTTQQVAAFFARGILCVRAYEPSSGAPHELPAWARPGNIASKFSSGRPRKRQKTSELSAAVVTPDLAALPPPQAYGQSQISITGQPNKPTKEGKRPHKRKMPASAASMQAKHHIGSGSIGSVGKKTKSGHLRQRRFICPSIPKSEACGRCINCLNPARKQACIVRREQMLAALEEQRASVSQAVELNMGQDQETMPPAEANHSPIIPQV